MTQRKFSKSELFILINSLQQHAGIVPQPPRKRPAVECVFPVYSSAAEAGE